MNTIRIMLLVFFVQVPALAIDIPDIQNKLFESSVSVKVGALKEGATGFFATPPGSNKQVIVTCLHCIIDNIQLNRLQMGRSVDMGQIWVQSLNGGNTFATKVIAYHAKADLVYLQSPFKQKMPELLFAEHAPEPEEMLFSLRYDWKKPEDTFSFSQSKMIATRNDHGTGEPSHIYHWGQTMLTGFSGGALVNEFSEVVGINFMTANPYYNLAEHYRGFKFIRWLEKPMDATTFFSGPMDVSNIAYNDVFWGLSSMEDQGFGYDINLIFNAYQNLSERTFVNFFFSRLMYDFWFDPLMDRIDPTSVDEKSEVALNKVLEVAGAAKKKFLDRMRIATVRSTLECVESRAHLKYKKLMKANVDQQEKENMIKACEYDIDLMKNERENFDRQYLGGDAAIDSTAYLQARLNEMERLKKIF